MDRLLVYEVTKAGLELTSHCDRTDWTPTSVSFSGVLVATAVVPAFVGVQEIAIKLFVQINIEI